MKTTLFILLTLLLLAQNAKATIEDTVQITAPKSSYSDKALQFEKLVRTFPTDQQAVDSLINTLEMEEVLPFCTDVYDKTIQLGSRNAQSEKRSGNDDTLEILRGVLLSDITIIRDLARSGDNSDSTMQQLVFALAHFVQTAIDCHSTVRNALNIAELERRMNAEVPDTSEYISKFLNTLHPRSDYLPFAQGFYLKTEKTSSGKALNEKSPFQGDPLEAVNDLMEKDIAAIAGLVSRNDENELAQLKLEFDKFIEDLRIYNDVHTILEMINNEKDMFSLKTRAYLSSYTEGTREYGLAKGRITMAGRTMDENLQALTKFYFSPELKEFIKEQKYSGFLKKSSPFMMPIMENLAKIYCRLTQSCPKTETFY